MIITPKEEYQKFSTGSEKRVKLKCDSCGKITTTTYANYYAAQRRHKRNGETYCRTCAVIASGKQRRGKSAWNKGKKLPNSQKGANHASWKGGSYISSDGYRMIYVPQTKKVNSNWEHYKKEHVVVIEQRLRRPIRNGEVIHHIDGDKLNNDIDNLYITDNKHHHQIHYSLFDTCRELIHLQLIIFDKKANKYVAHDKLRELLEHLVEDNQQPSLDGDIKKGSETSGESRVDNNSTKSAEHHENDDDIVRTIHITK